MAVNYREAVQDFMQEMADLFARDKQFETQLLMDEKRDHYQLLQLGWQNERRVYGCVLHIDVKGDQIWVQHNSTEFQIDQELARLGIPQEVVIAGFHAPWRQTLNKQNSSFRQAQ